jgi:regulatory protein
MTAARRPKKLAADALWGYALRVLGKRAHSVAELQRKLLLKASSPPDVTAVLARLREYGFSDDTKFSEAFASSRLTNQGFGRLRVLRELRARQVPPAVAGKAVAGAFAGTDEEQLAERFLTRKFRGKDLPRFLKDEKNLASAYRRLRTAGFSSGVTWSVLKRYNSRTKEWQEPETEE